MRWGVWIFRPVVGWRVGDVGGVGLGLLLMLVMVLVMIESTFSVEMVGFSYCAIAITE